MTRLERPVDEAGVGHAAALEAAKGAAAGKVCPSCLTGGGAHSPSCPKAPARKGWGSLTCPLCGQDCAISLNLEDLKTCTCPECSEDFLLDTVRDVIARWQRVLNWVSAASG
jgi:hypothetical protein